MTYVSYDIKMTPQQKVQQKSQQRTQQGPMGVKATYPAILHAFQKFNVLGFNPKKF